MPEVILNDVGPRDGLQNQPQVLEPADRARLVRALLSAGVTHVEAGAFVSPRAVPAMAGAAEVAAELADDAAGDASPVLTFLVPNMRGYELARESGVSSVCMVLYGSERMAQANVNMSREEAERATLEILQRAGVDGVRVTATVAVAFECPWEGPTDPGRIASLAARVLEHGADEFCVADTIGAANPRQVKNLVDRLVADNGATSLSCHFHDTRAMGLANVYAALEAGVRKFDAAIGGLGGCPFAPGASGNVASEDVIMMLEQMGLSTGIDLAALMRASALATELTGTAPGGRARAWLSRHSSAV